MKEITVTSSSDEILSDDCASFDTEFVVTPDLIPSMNHQQLVDGPVSVSERSERRLLTHRMPIIQGNLMFHAIGSLMLYPMQLSNHKNLVDRINVTKEKERFSNYPEMAQESFKRLSVLDIWRKRGFTYLYRGYPFYFIYDLSSMFVKKIARDIINHILSVIKYPDSDLLGIKKFHRSLCRWLHLSIPTDEQSVVPSSANIKQLNEDTPKHGSLVAQWLQQRPQTDQRQEEESRITKELIELAATLVSEAVCYPILTISRRQMVIDDDAGYSWNSMLNVSRVMDGGYGWLYRGLEWNIAREILTTACTITTEYVLDRADNVLMDNAALREASKHAFSMMTQPMIVVGNIEQCRSSTPGLVDDDVELNEMLDIAFTPTYRMVMSAVGIGLPIAYGLHKYINYKK